MIVTFIAYSVIKKVKDVISETKMKNKCRSKYI